MTRRPSPTHAAFTLVESIMSIVVVGVMFVAATALVSTSRAGQRVTADHSRGMLIAEALMNEILEHQYIDPDVSGTTLGRETGEVADDRTAWDDVDDYHGWIATPPRDKAGIALAGLVGWERRVTVEYINATNLTTVVAFNSGVKRITVDVYRDGRRVARLRTLRTGAKDTVTRKLKKVQGMEAVN